MSAAPTPPAAPPAPPAPGGGVVEFVRTQRANAAYLLLGLAAVFLAATVYLISQGERAGGTAPPPPAANPLEPNAPPPPEIENPKRGDYRVGWIGTALAALVLGVGGGTLLARPPKPTEAAGRSYARGFVLVVGGLLGIVLVAITLLYLVRWNEGLLQAIDSTGATGATDMRWVIKLLLALVAGVGLVFAAIQPARAEERSNQTLRRMVYGGNLALTVVLLLIALVIVNVVFAKHVPATLDTTETGFYTLSPPTKETFARLPEPVTAYVIWPDDGDRLTNDVRQLMYSAQEASGGKFTPRFVSPVTNKAELQQLQEKYPKLEKSAVGILLTAGGEDGKRSEFIPENDLFKQDFAPGGGGQKLSFVGEGALVQKVRFLGDADNKPVVYFTQGHGELSLSGGGPAGFAKADREATKLKTHLETLNMDVRPLEFKAGKAEVPADATVVVVADPLTPLPDDEVKALKAYMGRPGPADKKGKMVVMAEARPGGKDRKMAKTGLEGLLGEFNVKLGEQFIYSYPIPQYQLGVKDALIVFAGGKEGHPITQPFGRNTALFWTLPREAAPLSAAPGGPFTATPLLTTLPQRPTWLEDEIIDNPRQVLADFQESEALRSRKQLTGQARTVGVAVAEGGGPPNPMNPHAAPEQTPRLVVYANGEIFSNDVQTPRGGGTPPTHELMSATLDWLRGRPPIAPGVVAKEYTTYQLPPGETVNDTRLVWLPLGLALAAVAGFGAGVWVIRRK